jgi:DNA-binding NtrC family response regulator
LAILIIDDDPVQRRLLEGMLQKFGYEVVIAEGGDAGAALLTGPDGAAIDCVILDLVMPDLDGLGVLARLRQNAITVPVIVQTAHGGIDNVVSAMRAGAVDFVVKPVGAERLHVSLRNALTTSALEGELNRIKHSRSGTLGFKDIITKSPSMHAVLRMAEKAAASSIPVLVAGESGVGKELIARAIHGSGERRAKPFVAVNCGAMPENLVESILFGHEKGSFTGATERHVGKFVEASSGTLFLDEVGELPPAAQVKLLRAIQEGEVEPVGGRKPVKVDVRIVSATNRDLIADVKQGRFRADPALPGALCRRGRQTRRHGHAGRAAAPRRFPLAGQYPPVGKCRVPRRGPHRRRRCRHRRVSADHGADCGAGGEPCSGTVRGRGGAIPWCGA